MGRHQGRITKEDIKEAGFRRWDGHRRITTDWINVFHVRFKLSTRLNAMKRCVAQPFSNESSCYTHPQTTPRWYVLLTA